MIPVQDETTCGLGESLAQKISEFHRNFCFRDLISLTIDKQLCLTQNSVKKKVLGWMLLDFSTYFWISKHLILFETQPTSKGSLLIILHTELEKLENRTELAFG